MLDPLLIRASRAGLGDYGRVLLVGWGATLARW
jgi:hypothetical protein